ncbi:uncharacterized protein BJ171DRAFT_523028 [Polychytrium aggregatum]|uniref:uncharacterized protein n=1 Tax=Polychytrium aggregatum TaxID=110093 RepID=UPI0022FE028A|nr:uncharacterized protein BJ171DRAFT_523028 [Polychytrium aggregatum]KAI9197069.1 hypothetical protein BJ171DRAFT_523028 [Polychytrium aggregatum]
MTFCRDCRLQLCDFHRLSHQKTKSTSRHQLIAPTDLLQDPELYAQIQNHRAIFRHASHCPSHPDHLQVLFCLSCNTVVCELCYVLGCKDDDDRMHPVRPVLDHYPDAREQFQTLHLRSIESTLAKYQAFPTQLQLWLEQLSLDAAEARTQIRNRSQALHLQIQQREQQMLDQVADIETQTRRELEAQMATIQGHMDDLQDMHRDALQLLAGNNVFALLDALKSQDAIPSPNDVQNEACGFTRSWSLPAFAGLPEVDMGLLPERTFKNQRRPVELKIAKQEYDPQGNLIRLHFSFHIWPALKFHHQTMMFRSPVTLAIDHHQLDAIHVQPGTDVVVDVAASYAFKRGTKHRLWAKGFFGDAVTKVFLQPNWVQPAVPRHPSSDEESTSLSTLTSSSDSS